MGRDPRPDRPRRTRKSWTWPPNRMVSLVRPIAMSASSMGGGSGALPAPSTIASRGKPISWALCSATSTTRAAICTTPARLPVGVSTRVTRSGATPQSRETFSASAAGGWRSVSSTRQARSARSRYPSSSNSGSRTASARAGPEPSALNFLGTIEAQAPARRTGHRDRRAPAGSCSPPPATASRETPDFEPRVTWAETAHADAGDEQSGLDASLVVDAGIDYARAVLHAGDSDAQRVGSLLELGDQGAAIAFTLGRLLMRTTTQEPTISRASSNASGKSRTTARSALIMRSSSPR